MSRIIENKTIDNQILVESTDIENSGTILNSSGSVSLPSYSFSSDPNTGIYRIGADNLGITAGGVKQVDISTSATDFSGRIRAPNGTTALPGISFTGAPDVGLIGATGSLSVAVNNSFIGQFIGGATPGYYAQSRIAVPSGDIANAQMLNTLLMVIYQPGYIVYQPEY